MFSMKRLDQRDVPTGLTSSYEAHPALPCRALTYLHLAADAVLKLALP